MTTLLTVLLTVSRKKPHFFLHWLLGKKDHRQLCFWRMWEVLTCFSPIREFNYKKINLCWPVSPSSFIRFANVVKTLAKLNQFGCSSPTVLNIIERSFYSLSNKRTLNNIYTKESIFVYKKVMIKRSVSIRRCSSFFKLRIRHDTLLLNVLSTTELNQNSTDSRRRTSDSSFAKLVNFSSVLVSWQMC